MKSYTTGRALYGVLTKNTNTANLSFGDEIANDDYRAICAMKEWPFLERLRTLTTAASTQFYNLPYDCEKVRSVAVIVSSKRYVPLESPSREHWDTLNQTVVSSDIPQYYFIYDGQVGFWPTPVSASNTIYVHQKTRVIDLSIADYTTGSISAVTNGGTTVTGSGTSWTSQMVGRYLRITYSDTANTGDGQWYEIAGVTSGTSLTLERAYGGTTIAAESANYTIAQMPLLPEAFHDLPWTYAAGVYWQKENDPRGSAFLSNHGSLGEAGTLPTGRIKLLCDGYSSQSANMVIYSGTDDQIINPNLTISI